jgi:P-loop containing NTP hydrolase pore-1/C-terminal domain on Strawberry notch homologue
MATSTLERELTLTPFAGLPLFQFSLDNPKHSSVGTITLAPVAKVIPIEKVIRIPVEAPPKPKTQFAELVRLNYLAATKDAAPISDGVYTPYRASAIQIPGALPHPTQLAESIALAAIDAPMPTYQPLLPAETLFKNLASHEQLEALIYACDAHNKHMDTRWYINDKNTLAVANADNSKGKYHRCGFFVGDSTGVGKGREASLIILANWCEGRKRAIWISKNDALIEDSRRDWEALGGNPDQIVSLSKFKLGEPITLSEGILFVTYGQLGTGAKNGKKSRVDQICDWAGEDFEGVIAFDESHLLGNCIAEKGERGTSKPSNRGVAGVSLVDRLWDARVTYLSATGAAKVASLSYCTRLGLWMTRSFPFTSREDFVNSMNDAGLAAMEVVSQDFKRLGLYLARTLSFEGVKFETVTHELTAAQLEIWDTYAEAFRHVHHQIDEVARTINLVSDDGKCTNGRAKALTIGAFESTKQRFFAALLCAAKAPTLIASIERDLEAGHACVIQLVSTGAALMDRKLASIPTSEWNNMRAIDFTPRDGICDYLINSFPIHLYQIFQDEDGNERSELMTDADGNPVISQEAVAMRDELIGEISMLPPVNGLLDQINWHFGADRVAEVTGRSKRVIFKDDRYQLSQRSGTSSVAETTAFQSDEKQILVFSAAGGTGRSYHASLSCANQRLRRHYMVETGWEAIGATQAVGRSHRSAQKQPPEVILLTTDVKGEARFVSTIASRLGTLGAISKGQRNTGNQGLFSDVIDFSSIYAKAALTDFFNEMMRRGIDGISCAEFIDYTGLRLKNSDGSYREELPKMNTFLNRLLALKIDIQNRLFANLEGGIHQRISEAKANGSYDLGIQTIQSNGGFELVESQLLTTHSSGAETICHSIDKRTKPFVINVDRAKKAALKEGFAYYRHIKNGNLAVAHVVDQKSGRDGSMVDVMGLYYPTHHESLDKMSRSAFEKSWVIADPSDLYWKQWQKQINEAPEYNLERLYLICGLLLPIWGQLPDETPEVFRLQTTDSQVFLGRAVTKEAINKVYQSFGINSIKLTPSDILKLVWELDDVGNVGQWQIKKNKYKGEDRIEIIAVDGKDKIEWLKSFGCFTEVIDWKTEVFIPVDNALAVITELMPVL